MRRFSWLSRVAAVFNASPAVPPIAAVARLAPRLELYGDATTVQPDAPPPRTPGPPAVAAWAARRRASVLAGSVAPPSVRLDLAAALDGAVSATAACFACSARQAEFALSNGVAAARLPPVNALVRSRLSRATLAESLRAMPIVGAGCQGAMRIVAHVAMPLGDGCNARGPLSKFGSTVTRLAAAVRDAGLPPLLPSPSTVGLRSDADRVAPQGAAALAHALLHARAASGGCSVLFLATESNATSATAPGDHSAAAVLQVPGEHPGAPPRFRVLAASLRSFSMQEWLRGAGHAAASPYSAAGWVDEATAHAFVSDFFAAFGEDSELLARVRAMHERVPPWTPALADAARHLAGGARAYTPTETILDHATVPQWDPAARDGPTLPLPEEDAEGRLPPCAFFAAWVSAHDFTADDFAERLEGLLEGLRSGALVPLIAV